MNGTLNRIEIENLIWHIEVNREVRGDKKVLEDVLESLKNRVKFSKNKEKAK